MLLLCTSAGAARAAYLAHGPHLPRSKGRATRLWTSNRPLPRIRSAVTIGKTILSPKYRYWRPRNLVRTIEWQMITGRCNVRIQNPYTCTRSSSSGCYRKFDRSIKFPSDRISCNTGLWIRVILGWQGGNLVGGLLSKYFWWQSAAQTTCKCIIFPYL